MNLMDGGSSDGHSKFFNSDTVQRSELEGKDSHLPARVFWGVTTSEDRGRICCLLKLGHAGLLGFQLLLLTCHHKCGVGRELQPQLGPENPERRKTPSRWWQGPPAPNFPQGDMAPRLAILSKE